MISAVGPLQTRIDMTRGAQKVDPKTQIVGFDSDLAAALCANGHELSEPIEGMTFGVATMSEDAPHGGERHLGGDELLYLVHGRARLVFTDDPLPDVEMRSGDVFVVPRGLWHRVEILDPCHFVYLTPGHRNEIRPLESKTEI